MSKNKLRDIDNVLRIVDNDISVLEARIAHNRELRQKLLEFRKTAEFEDGTIDCLPTLGEVSARNTRVRTSVVQVKAVRNALYEILRESDGPMHPRELLPLLAQRGLIIEGDRATANVRSHLSHDVRFHSVGTGRWDLVSRPTRSTVLSVGERPRTVQDSLSFESDVSRFEAEALGRDSDDVPF